MSTIRSLSRANYNHTLIISFLIFSFIFFTLSYPIPAKSQIISDQQKPSNSTSPLKIERNSEEEYKIKSGDEVTIIVDGYEDYSKTFTVDQDGKLTYLSLGSFQAEGSTQSQLQKQIEYVLQPYVSLPKVTISVKKADMVVKIGDMVNIIVKGDEDNSQTVVVQKNGRIKYLDFDEIQVAGLKTSEIKTEIENKLKEIISKPEVTISTEPKDYVFQSGDTVNITVTDNQKYNYTSIIGIDGQIIHPILGELKISGKTADMIQNQIKEALKPYISDPKVNVSGKKQMKALTETVEEEKPEEKKESQKIEEEKPEKKEYMISTGDLISIRVKDNGNYNLDVIVQPDGQISYPSLGEFQAVGFTESQIAQNIASKLVSYISNPLVNVTIKGKVDFVAIKPAQTADYILKLGDVIQIRISERKNYDHTMVIQPNGRIYYPPLGEINAVGSPIATLNNIIRSSLPFRVNTKQISISIKQLKPIANEIQQTDITESPLALRRYGYDFFTNAKNIILKAEKNQSVDIDKDTPPKDAISGFVGPMDMMNANVNATVPDKYILGANDKITVTYWTDAVEPVTEFLIVNEKGEVTIEKLGKIVVRGMTLAQFEETVKAGLSRIAYKNLQLTATLEELRSIQIFITGEAFRHGSYAVSAVTTLFNALYMCGGPNENGSLRDIKFIRRNETKSIDLYKYLMKGDSNQDYNLEAGDTIMIPLVGRTITISGEVKKPAIYELKEDENLKELIAIAGNIRPTGFLQRVRVDSVDPSRRRIVVDVDLTNPNQAITNLFDGDIVTVFSIPSEKMNTVNIEGKIRMPGTYQLKDGMRVADLINSAQGLLGEVYMERADLIRLNPDKKTTNLIPIDLSKVLSGDIESNVILSQWDKLIIYSKWDVKWVANRVANIHGAIQHPGSYERSDGMKIYDLLIKSGGVMPNAYLDRALLFRRDETDKITKNISINLDLAMTKDENNNIDLQDGDILVIYTKREAKWEPEREVIVSGAVQNSGNFIRTDGMRVSDLIKIAGGLLRSAYPDRALLLRLDERQRITQGFTINLKLALQDDPKDNLELKDGDEIIVYTYKQAIWEPNRQVAISGAVQNPCVFPKTDGMKVSDLIHRAGGVMQNAYLDRANIERFLPNEERYIIIPVNLAKSLSGDESYDLALENEDNLRVYTLQEAEYRPNNIVTIYGAVQKPDIYTRYTNMKLSDLIFISGGLLPGASKSIDISRINDMGMSVSILIDVTNMLKGDNTNDPELMDKDTVFVRKEKGFLDDLYIVTLDGEVKYPGDYVIKHNERLSEVIKRAGGLTDRAYSDASTIMRRVEYLVLSEQEKSLRQVGRLLDELANQKYQRESTQAWLEHGNKTNTNAASPSGSSATDIIKEAAVLGANALAGGTPLQTNTITNLEELKKIEYTMVTPARKMNNLLPSGRLLINVNEAISVPGSKDDIILENGDVIAIPLMPSTVTITGAVMQPSSHLYQKGKSAKYYIDISGGFAEDADVKSVYVVKANGMVSRAKNAKLSVGDIIVVPAKVIVQKVTDRWGQLFGIFKFTISIFAAFYTLKLVVGK
jgi:polysaccharide export outer membrane protein